MTVIDAQAPAAKSRAILAAMNFSVPEFETPTSYKFAIAGLISFLAVAVLGFAALVVFLAWLVVWHTLNAIASFGQGPYFLFHLPMAILGAMLLVLLLKPLFFRQRTRKETVITLSRKEEPVLFEFVEKLSAATGSEVPMAIEVDCDSNAHARLQSLTGGGVVLRIGLPLVAALRVRQLSAVLAHEFGHFNQRGAMRGSNVLYRFLFVFARIVYDRDRIDAWIARQRQSRTPIVRVLALATLALTEPMRGVLWLALFLGQLCTCHMSRRMEYDADDVAVQVAGSQEFVRMHSLLIFLSIAQRRAYADLQHAWKERRLADNLPRLIVANARQLAEHRDDILKHLRAEKTGFFSTHPCHNDRAKNAQDQAVAGMFTVDASTRHLFSNFDSLCRTATIALHKSFLGKSFNAAQLVSSNTLIEMHEAEGKSLKSLRRYFRGQVRPGNPVLPSPESMEAPDVPLNALAELKAARQKMIECAGIMGDAAEMAEDASGKAVVARARCTLSRLFPTNPNNRRLQKRAMRDQKENEEKLLDADERLAPFEAAANRRLTAALQLAQCDSITKRMGAEGAKAREEVRRLIGVCEALRPLTPTLLGLREASLQLRVFHASYNSAQPYRPLVDRILQTGGEVKSKIGQVFEALSTVPYPFEHGTAGISMGAAMVNGIPNSKDPGDCYAVASSAVDRFFSVQFRVLAALTQWAEKVESACKLPALEDMPPSPKKDDTERTLGDRIKGIKRIAFEAGRAAAGMLLLYVLLAWSINPPAMNIGGGDNARPAGFSMASSVRFGPYHPTPAWNPRSGNGQQMGGGARQPPGFVVPPMHSGPSPAAPQYHVPTPPAPTYRPPAPPTYHPPTTPSTPPVYHPPTPTPTTPPGYHPPAPTPPGVRH